MVVLSSLRIPDPYVLLRDPGLLINLLRNWLSHYGSKKIFSKLNVQADILVFISSVQFSSVQSLSRVRLFETPWTAARQASLSTTNSWSLLKLRSIESVMLSNHLILCRPLFLLPSIFPGIRVFSSESVLPVRWPKYWSFSFCISPSNEHWKNSFPRTIITKYYKLGGVNDRNLFSHISRD